MQNDYLPLALLNDKDIQIFDTITKSVVNVGKDVLLDKIHWSILIAFMLPFQKRRYINFVQELSKNISDVEKFNKSFFSFNNKKIIDAIVEDTINSKNEISSIIFSKLLIDIIENNKQISHEDIACSEIIRAFNDFDIKNFIYIYENPHAQDYPNKQSEILNDGYNYVSVSLTGDKLKNLSLHDTANYFALCNGGIVFNETASTLYNFLIRENIKKIIEDI